MDLSALQADALKEFGNIGTGHAATALSMMLDCKVDCNIPSVQVVLISQAMQVISGVEDVVIGIFQKVYGKVKGSILITFPRDSAFRVLDVMLGKREGESKILGAVEISALQELGNILSGAYLTALSHLTGLLILPTVPDTIVDMLGTILECNLTDLCEIQNYTLLVETRIMINKMDVDGRIFLFPDAESLQLILEGFGLR